MKFKLALIFFLIILASVFLPNSLPKTEAQSCTTTTPQRADGLVSTPQESPTTGVTKFGTSSGACISNPKVAFAPYKVPSFDDLRSLYFDQAKPSTNITKTTLTGDKSGSSFDQGDIPMTPNSDHLYYIKKTNPTNGNLTITHNIPGNQTGVVFVEGNLTIGPMPGANPPNQINDGTTNATANSGLVFVVKGNVNIDQSVTRIDAVIISEGIICTAYDGSSCLNGNTITPQLIINGGLISINQNDTTPIKFSRTLNPSAAFNNSNSPAEKINYQAKYLVLMRNLISDTFQRWSEISGSTVIATPTPTSVPTPTPTYKRVFVTSNAFTGGALSSIRGADFTCLNAATSASLGGSWNAWISDSNSSPSTRFNKTSLPYKLLNGVQIASGYAGLTSAFSALSAPINIDEHGNVLSGIYVWTNTNKNGSPTSTSTSTTCSGWTHGNPDHGFVGRNDQTDSNFTIYNPTVSPYAQLYCDTSNVHLYCFEQ